MHVVVTYNKTHAPVLKPPGETSSFYVSGMVAYSVKLPHSEEQCVLVRKYLRYLHQTNTIVFTIIVAIKRIEYYCFSIIIGNVGPFDYVICSLADAHCQQMKCE